MDYINALAPPVNKNKSGGGNPVMSMLPALALTVATGNPMFLAGAATGMGVSAATGSPTAGKVAGVVAGGGLDPSTVAPSLLKEGGMTVAGKVDPRLETALRMADVASSAGKKLDPNVPNSAASKDTMLPAKDISKFKKALPYLGLLAPAAISYAKTGKVTPGLKVGTALLQGLSTIQDMEVTAAQEKDRATEKALEIKDLQAESERKNKPWNYKLDPLYTNGTESQKQFDDDLMSQYGESLTMGDRDAILKTKGQDPVFVAKRLTLGNQDRLIAAISAKDKYKNAVEKFGADSMQAINAKKEADKKEAVYYSAKGKGDKLLNRLEELGKKKAEFAAKYSKDYTNVPEFLESNGSIPLIPRKKGTAGEGTSKMKDAAYLKTQGFTDKEANQIAYDIGKGKVTREGLKMRLVEKIFAKTQPDEMRDAQLDLIPKQLDYVFGKEEEKDVPGKDVDSTEEVFTLPDGSTATQSDIEFTAKKYDMTIEEVKKKLGIK